MTIVRKLDRELKLRRWISKRQARLISWRRLRVTHRTDGRPRAAEKLRTMTTHARVVIGIILDIGKSNFVTGITGCFVFLSRMRELRIINRLLLGH